MYWLTSASRAAASIRRAPSRTISSTRSRSDGGVFVDYAEHGRARPDPRCNAGLLGDHQSITREKYALRVSRSTPPEADPQVLSIAPHAIGASTAHSAVNCCLLLASVAYTVCWYAEPQCKAEGVH